MKLLYFCIQMDQVGGVAKIESEKINWLVAHGYDVTVCDIESWEMQPYYPLDPRVKFMIGDISTTPGNPWVRLKGVVRALRRTKEIIRQERPDIIVNAHCPLVTWLIPWIAGRATTIAEMHQSRQGLEVFNRQFMGRFGQWLHRWSIRWIYGRYDRFVCLTAEDQQAWNLKNAMVIPNFSSLSRGNGDNQRIEGHEMAFAQQEKPYAQHMEPACREKGRKEKRQIIMIARLAPQKRIDLMMQVWQRLYRDFPDWQVKVLGDGFGADYLRGLCREMGLEKSFLMPGAVKDVRAELGASDILCLTSEYEGFGIVLIEAMQLGVPVMAFEYVGVRDIIRDGHDGYVVPFGDVELYAQRLRALMESDEQRRQLSANALVSVRKFDKEEVMHRWVALFEEIRSHPR